MPKTDGLKPSAHWVVYGLWFFGIFGILITSEHILNGLVAGDDLYIQYSGPLWALWLASIAGLAFSYFFHNFVMYGFSRPKKKK
jgi:hypothetical protein